MSLTLRPLGYASSILLASSVALAACASSPGKSPIETFDASQSTPDAKSPDAVTSDAATRDVGAPDAKADASAADAAAVRNASCTPTSAQTGTAVDSKTGRLDGTLVYVIPVGEDPVCNGDSSHVHLQIEVSGSVYDVAVDIGTAPNDEVGYLEETETVPGGVWSEGWHSTDALTYPTLGIHSTAFGLMSPTAVAAAVQSALATTTKISIFCTGYKQGDGCHDVHYEHGDGDDGAIVLDPTSATSPMLFFRFATPTF